MELTEYITDLLVDFDEMGFAPTTTVPNPEAYAIEWRNKITKAFEELTEENEKLRKTCISKDLFISDIIEENNMLHTSCTELTQKLHECKPDTVNMMYLKIKERCIKEGIFFAPMMSIITKVSKEMLEGL